MGGIEPGTGVSSHSNKTDTKPVQNNAKSLQVNGLDNNTQNEKKHDCAFSKQEKSTSLQKKCVTYVQQNSGSFPEDLVEVVAAWDNLPVEIKSGLWRWLEPYVRNPE